MDFFSGKSKCLHFDLLFGLAPTIRKWGQSVRPRSRPSPKLSKVHWADRPLALPMTHLSITFLPVIIVTFSGSSTKKGSWDNLCPEVKPRRHRQAKKIALSIISHYFLLLHSFNWSRLSHKQRVEMKAHPSPKKTLFDFRNFRSTFLDDVWLHCTCKVFLDRLFDNSIRDSSFNSRHTCNFL